MNDLETKRLPNEEINKLWYEHVVGGCVHEWKETLADVGSGHILWKCEKCPELLELSVEDHPNDCFSIPPYDKDPALILEHLVELMKLGWPSPLWVADEKQFVIYELYGAWFVEADTLTHVIMKAVLKRKGVDV